MYSDRLGYITLRPWYWHASQCAIKLPALCKNRDHLDLLANAYNLQVRGTGGMDTPIIDDVVDTMTKKDWASVKIS